jgi:TonB family protein
MLAMLEESAPSEEVPKIPEPQPKPQEKPQQQTPPPAKVVNIPEQPVQAMAAPTKPVVEETVAQKVTEPVPAPAPQPKPVERERHMDVSANYEQYVLASLERAKHYPTSREARLRHPEGTVRIWLELDRNGQVTGAGVVDSSGSNLLDSESLHTVRSTSFPAFPQQAYVDQPSHRFIASLKYEIPH